MIKCLQDKTSMLKDFKNLNLNKFMINVINTSASLHGELPCIHIHPAGHFIFAGFFGFKHEIAADFCV